MDLSTSVKNKEKEQQPSEGQDKLAAGVRLDKLSPYTDIRLEFGDICLRSLRRPDI